MRETSENFATILFRIINFYILYAVKENAVFCYCAGKVPRGHEVVSEPRLFEDYKK